MKYWKNESFDANADFGTVESLAFAVTEKAIPLEKCDWIECKKEEIDSSKTTDLWQDEGGVYYSMP